MSKRKSRRKLRLPAVRRRKYDDNAELHDYEDALVLRILIARGKGSAREWCKQEPGRWNQRLLDKTFIRLDQRRLAMCTHRYGPSSNFAASRWNEYIPTSQEDNVCPIRPATKGAS
jgi:hypothetical protein